MEESVELTDDSGDLLPDEKAGKVSAEIEAAFRAGFNNQRGSDREIRVRGN